MAEIKIKEGSVIIEFWDDKPTPEVFVVTLPDAKLKPGTGLKAVRSNKKGGNQPGWDDGPAVNVPEPGKKTTKKKKKKQQGC